MRLRRKARLILWLTLMAALWPLPAGAQPGKAAELLVLAGRGQARLARAIEKFSLSGVPLGEGGNAAMALIRFDPTLATDRGVMAFFAQPDPAALAKGKLKALVGEPHFGTTLLTSQHARFFLFELALQKDFHIIIVFSEPFRVGITIISPFQ